MNWIDYLEQIKSNLEDSSIDFGFNLPSTDSLLNALMMELNLSELPIDLEELYKQTNGIFQNLIVDGVAELTIGDLIWSIEKVIKINKEYRHTRYFREVNKSFEELLFFSDAGNGDLFAMVISNGKFEQNDIFCWNHENDIRSWVAPNLKTFVKCWIEGKISV